MPAATLRIDGLKKADFLEMSEFVDPDALSSETTSVGEGNVGELATLAVVVVVSAVALKGFVAYLMYRHRGESFEETIEIESPEGAKVKRTIRYRKSEGEPGDVAVARELSNLSGLPLKEIIGAG
jgi:hypothetical protein